MITFILTHKQRERSTIAILVSFKGKKYRRLIKESILTALWLPKKKRAKVVSGDASALMVNAMIDKWEMSAMQAVTHFKQFVYPPSADEFFAMILDKVYLESKQEEASGPICFVEYTEKFIDRYKGAKSESCIKKYNTALNKLKEFEKDREVRLMFEDMNIEFYNDFKQWFFDQRFSTNYFGNMIKVIKQVYREARVVDKVHAGDDIEHRDFVGTRVDTESIYLSELELSRIVDLDLSIDSLEINYPSMDQEQLRKKSESYKRVRERFLIGAYTGLRVSDFCRLSDINFDKEFIRIRAQKTGSDVIVPIHPVIRAILDSGFDKSVSISDQKINKHIKEIARLACINERVLINRSEGAENIEQVFEKWQLVTTHTARRSFATNAYKAGVPTIAIMRITGHTKESTFLKYIKITNQENAELLQSHPFFSGKM